jgi:antitoxin (DNA-binding transcriptional repressor) of toxin-antitoxin stability system
MNVAVAVLNERMPEVLEALGKRELVVLSHDGQDVALLQPISRQQPAVGMWDDREDMKNPSEWVRNLRRPRYDSILSADDGDVE